MRRVLHGGYEIVSRAERRATLKGPHGRVQLVVFDFTGPDNPAAWREERPNFCVTTLPADAHQSTAFAKGRQRYFGDDAEDALEIAARHWGLEIDPASDFPPSLAKYFAGECTTPAGRGDTQKASAE